MHPEGDIDEDSVEEEVVIEEHEEIIEQQPSVQPVYTQIQQPAYQQQMPRTVITQGGAQPSVLAAYLLWFFLGWLGVHHLYMGRGIGIWILSLISFQGLFLWWIVDLFLIPSSCSKVRGQQVVIAA
jgi:hypothetical protein